MVDQLAKHPEQLVLGGEHKDLSFVFTDIAGFTTLSERLPTDQLVPLLNDYLDGMCEVVLKNHGTIDKFIGDAVVAIFGAPTSQSDHAARAIRSRMAPRHLIACNGIRARLRRFRHNRRRHLTNSPNLQPICPATDSSHSTWTACNGAKAGSKS